MKIIQIMVTGILLAVSVSGGGFVQVDSLSLGHDLLGHWDKACYAISNSYTFQNDRFEIYSYR